MTSLPPSSFGSFGDAKREPEGPPKVDSFLIDQDFTSSDEDWAKDQADLVKPKFAEVEEDEDDDSDVTAGEISPETRVPLAAASAAADSDGEPAKKSFTELMDSLPPEKKAEDVAPRIDPLAIASLITAFFVGLVGLILGICSLGRIKSKGMRGKGLAIAGIIIGFLQTIGLALVALAFAGLVSLGSSLTLDLDLDESPTGGSTEVEEVTEDGAPTAPPEVIASETAYTPEFCAAFTAASETVLAAVSGETMADGEMLTAVSSLAQMPSTNQPVYVEFHQKTLDFMQYGLAEDNPSTVFGKFNEAITADAAACV